MSAFTRLGSALWDWEPWTNRTPSTRLLWLALYTSGEAKRHVPGLWQGGLPSMADAARMTPDGVINSLDELLEHELVEYDPKTRVLRLCELPDPGEYPSNGKVIRGWWTKFQTVPDCAVRDAHVRTLQWILHEGAKRSGKKVTPDHMEAWGATFSMITVPAPRRRGVRRLADSDTSNAVQPSLFPSQASPLLLGNGIEATLARSYPQDVAQAVDNSASLRQTNKISGPETVSDTNRIPDPGSRIPESFFSSPDSPITMHSAKPVLSLVYTVEDVFAVLRTGRWDPMFEDSHHEAIGSRLALWASGGTTLADFRVLAEYSAVFGKAMNARWLASSDLATIQQNVAHARSELHNRRERLAMLAEYKS